MSNDYSVGDDYSVPCPHCGKTIRIHSLYEKRDILPRPVDICNSCGKKFQIDNVTFIPVVWVKKYDQDTQADVGSNT